MTERPDRWDVEQIRPVVEPTLQQHVQRQQVDELVVARREGLCERGGDREGRELQIQVQRIGVS